MHPQSWAYEAGRNEEAGRVMEPRKRERRGPQDHPHGGERATPTACSGRKAAVLEAPRRGPRTPPGSASGAGVHRGDAGTWESPGSPGVIAGGGGPPDEVKTPGVARRRPPRTRAGPEQGPPSQRRDPRHRGRRGSTARPREGLVAVFAEQSPAGWERCAPGRAGGAPVPGPQREGRRRLGLPFAGRTSGSDAGRTHRLQDTPEHSPPGQGLSGDGVQPRVARAGPGGRAGTPRDRTRTTRAPGVEPGRPSRSGAPRRHPPGPARAAARAAVGAPRRRGGSAKDDGQQRPRGPPGCEATRVQRAVGLMREAIDRAGMSGVLPGLAAQGPGTPKRSTRGVRRVGHGTSPGEWRQRSGAVSTIGPGALGGRVAPQRVQRGAE